MAETIGEALGQVPGGSGLGVTVMQRIMGLVCEHKVLPLTQSPPPYVTGLEVVNRARSGGIDQGKPVFGTFKGERYNERLR